MKVFHLLIVLLVGLVCGTSASRCPPRIKVQNPTPKCRDNYDCRKYYQICCPNAYNAMSCTYPGPFERVRDHKHYKDGKHSHSSFKTYGRQDNSVC